MENQACLFMQNHLCYSSFSGTTKQGLGKMINAIYVGIDAGSRTTKLVAIDADGNVLRRAIADQSIHPAATARRLLDETCGGEHVAQCVATGYARHVLPFADHTVTEITCHAKGCATLHPETDAIIEIGGQDSKFIRLEQGRVHDFVMNDRCAAGTGRFLEVVAVRLGVALADLEPVFRDVADMETIAISSMCVVFAETEIIGLLASGTPPGVIMRSVQQAIATRIVAMTRDRKPLDKTILFTGGVAQIHGMKNAFVNMLGRPLLIPEHPQYTGALGAALLARERAG